MKTKEYLGDSVYIEEDEGGLVRLTTEDGVEASNTIYLEPEVVRAMAEYLGFQS